VAEQGRGRREESLPFVTEADARGETAAIFADIRETLGLPVVNLIWRHFATIDGGLRFAWDTLRPVYAGGAAERAGAHLVAGLGLPRLVPVPAAVLRGAGVADAERATLLAVIDSYNRGNALNICALAALLVEPGGEPREELGVAPLPRPGVAVPPLDELASLPAPVQELVWALNALGQPQPGDVLATLFKHLAPWPGVLVLAWGLLAPLHRDGRLPALIDECVRAAHAEAARIAHLKAVPESSAAVAPVREAAAHFVERMIGRMVPIGYLLRGALPET